MLKRILSVAVFLPPLLVGSVMAADIGPLIANWKVFELNGKPVDGPTLDYAEDKVTGNAGCNRFFGPIAITGDDKVKIGPLGATRMFCDGKMDMERDYLAALQGATTFALEDGILILKDDGGQALARFKK